MGGVKSIAPKIGCVAQTLLDWIVQSEVDAGARTLVTTAVANRIKNKAELVHRCAPRQRPGTRRNWQSRRVCWVLHHRLLSSIGYIPLADAEANNYGNLTRQPNPMPTCLNPMSLHDGRGDKV